MKKKSKRATPNQPIPQTVGRKRDPSLDAQILEATILTIADVGFDNMTMDEVAARAGSAKTTLYRRWDSKFELVRDALVFMSRNSVNVETMPDTGTLRGDLLAVQKDYSSETRERKVRVLSGLGGFFASHPTIRDEVNAGVFGPLTEMNRKLMERAVERREISATADREMACHMIIASIAYRTMIQSKSFDKAQYAKLLDAIILPALRSGTKY